MWAAVRGNNLGWGRSLQLGEIPEDSVVSHQQAKSWELGNESFGPQRVDLHGAPQCSPQPHARSSFRGVVRAEGCYSAREIKVGTCSNSQPVKGRSEPIDVPRRWERMGSSM